MTRLTEFERLPSHELRSPLHIVRCFGQLAVLYAQEIAHKVEQALDDAWPDDEAEDQEVHSDVWSRS